MARTWRTVVGLVVGAVVVGFTAVTPEAGQAAVADRILQEALTKEVVEQDIAAAIRLFEQVLATPGVSSAAAARARTHLAALRPKILRSDPAGAGSSPSPRRVLDGEWTELYDMSADGRWVVGQRVVKIGTQELVVRDLATGIPRVLAMGGGGPEISDDGTRVAYGGGPRGLMVVGTESNATPATLLSEAGTIIRAHDWAPNGSAVLASLVRMNDPARSGQVEYVWVSVADKVVRSIRNLERWSVPAGGGVGHATEPEVSPDGRFIGFVARPAADSQDLYLYVMDADGRSLEPVVVKSGLRGWPKWTPDGRHLLFTEERGDDTELWSVAVADGRAAGEPRMLYGNLGNDSALLGIVEDGVLHYRRNDFGKGRHAGVLSHVVPRALATAGPQPKPVTFRGCCASWSPDGQRLAYLADESRVIVRSVETGQERSYQLRGVAATDLSNLDWFHNASALILLGVSEAHSGSANTDAELSYYRVDLGSGEATPLLNLGPLRSWNGALSKDDGTFYLAKRDVPEGPFTQVVAVDIATGAETPIAALPANITANPQIAVSREGTVLAIGTLEGQSFQGNGRIFTVNIDGTEWRDVGGGGLPGFWGGAPLQWSPDGRSLLFRTYDAGGDWRITRIAASGGAPEFDGVSYQNLSPLVPDFRMTRGNFIGFDVSLDGSRLVLSTLVTPKYEVWALDLAPLLRGKGR